MTPYAYTEIDLRPFKSMLSASAIRKRLMLHFSNENPGTGKQEKTSRYRYLVESLEDGEVISIVRPGRKSGIDFKIEVSGWKFSNKTNSPRYIDVYEDLALKRQKDEKLYAKLLYCIDAVYRCEELKPNRLKTLMTKYSGTGYPVDLLLCLVKWFLIEQDVHYWNASGRDCKFYHNIPR